jgi:nitroreductase
MTLDTLEAIRTRRVARNFTDKPVPEEMLWTLLEAARWAPSASGFRIHRYVVLTERKIIRQIQMVSPGMTGSLPPSQILICINWKLAGYSPEDDYVLAYIDVGTAAQNMLLATHALGLSAGPFTGFSPDAVRVVLNLPEHWSPELFVNVGYRDDRPSSVWQIPKVRIDPKDMVQWGPFAEGEVSCG